MNCARCRQLLPGLLEQHLTAGDGLAVEAHLASCAACHAEHESEIRCRGALSHPFPLVMPPADLYADLLARTARPPAFRYTRVAWPALAMLALLLLAICIRWREHAVVWHVMSNRLTSSRHDPMPSALPPASHPMAGAVTIARDPLRRQLRHSARRAISRPATRTKGASPAHSPTPPVDPIVIVEEPRSANELHADVPVPTTTEPLEASAETLYGPHYAGDRLNGHAPDGRGVAYPTVCTPLPY